jgi:hypothetical protein
VFTVERRVGRLIEVRVQSMRTRTDAELFAQAVRTSVFRTAAIRAILCADLRAVPIFPPPVVNELISLFSGMSAHVDRAGLLIAPSNATFSMQMERIVRESHNPSHRLFYEADPMVVWLAEPLTEAEATRMRAFMARGQRGGWPGRVHQG